MLFRFWILFAVAVIARAQTFTTLFSCYNDHVPATPGGALVQGTDGNFYGTTSGAGATGHGSVFRITSAGVLTTLYSFSGGSDGGIPGAGLILATDGNFFGTTSGGGAYANNGTIFEITSAGSLTTLYSFGGTDGYQPLGLIQGTCRAVSS